MASQVYINYKFRHTYKHFAVGLAIFSLFFISLEDLIDYQSRGRERLKLIYFRDELIYIIYFIQIIINFKREKLIFFEPWAISWFKVLVKDHKIYYYFKMIKVNFIW